MPCNCNKKRNGLAPTGMPFKPKPVDRSGGVTLVSPTTGKTFELYPQTNASKAPGLIRGEHQKVKPNKEERRRLRKERKAKEERRRLRRERKERERLEKERK